MDALIKIFYLFLMCCVANFSDAQIVYVSTASQLQTALNNATPGQIISIQDGYYERSGGFYAVAGIDGTAANPITVIGSRNVILSTNNISSGYAFSLKGNKYWIIKGFTVTNSKNGVVIDSSKYITIDSIQAKKVGQDGVHLRTYSSYCVVKNCYIDSTGLNDYSFGEGVYVGSAYSNWCTYTDCNPDTSNYNQVLNNTFGSFITAENIDIKEGTKGGLVKGNIFNGAGLQGMNGGDSWIDVKGNYYTIEENIGNNSILDGFQTHIQQPGGYGNYNTFRNNTLNVNATGYGIRVQVSNANGTATGNIVCTNNIVSGAAAGLANVATSNCTNVFPLVLKNWNALIKGDQLYFSWEVFSKDGIEKFVIEQSKNGKDFSALQEQSVAGNIYSLHIPATADLGKYFRLVIIMKGEKLYSRIIHLDNKSSSYKMSVENNRLVVQYPGISGSLLLSNEIGQNLGVSSLKQGFNYFSLASVPKVYVVTIMDQFQRTAYSRLLYK